jgi:putative transposase
MTVSTKAIPDELLDALMSNYQTPEDLIGANGLLKQLTKDSMVFVKLHC